MTNRYMTQTQSPSRSYITAFEHGRGGEPLGRKFRIERVEITSKENLNVKY